MANEQVSFYKSTSSIFLLTLDFCQYESANTAAGLVLVSGDIVTNLPVGIDAGDSLPALECNQVMGRTDGDAVRDSERYSARIRGRA
jgi:hypothetical protein